MNAVCGSRSAAQHSLDLLSESLVDQSIYERIDGRVKQNHYGGNGISDIAGSVGGAVIAQNEDNSVCQPTDGKDNTDGNHH